MRLIILFCSVFFLFACKDKLREDVLPAEKMEAVLWDLMQADELVDYYLPTDSTYRTVARRQQVYQQVFDIHKITEKQFDASYRFYQRKPKLLKTIFDSLQASGERNQLALADSARRKPENDTLSKNKIAPEEQ